MLAPLVGSLLGTSSPIRPAAAEQQYHLASLHAVADVQTDGSIRMTEELTFQFDLGTFTYAYRDLPWRGFDELRDVQVLDQSGQPLPATVMFAAKVTGDWHIRWTYPSTAAPAARWFSVQYTLTNALAQPASDRNRLDWMAVGTGWSVWILNASATVRLPSAAGDSADFAYSPIPTSVAAVGKGTELNYTIGRLEPQTGFRILVDVPKFLDVRTDLIRISRESPLTMTLLTFLAVTAFMVALWAWKGREPRARTTLSQGILSTPPSELRPGEVAYLLSQEFGPAGMLGELLWLAKRGFLVFHGVPEGLRLKEEPRRLDVTEKGRAAWPPGSPEGRELNEPERVLLQALSRTTRRPELAPQTEHGGFARAMETRILDLGYLEARPSKVRVRYGVAAALVGATGAALLLLGRFDPSAFSVQGVSAGLLVSSLSVGVTGYFIPRLTRAGAEERARWRNFLQGLRWRVDSVRRTDPRSAVSLFDEYVEFLPLVPGMDLPSWLKKLSQDLRGVPYEPTWYRPFYSPVLLPYDAGHGVPAVRIGDVSQAVALDFSTFAHAFGATLGFFAGAGSPSGGGAVGGGGGGGVGGGGGGAG